MTDPIQLGPKQQDTKQGMLREDIHKSIDYLKNLSAHELSQHIDTLLEKNKVKIVLAGTADAPGKVLTIRAYDKSFTSDIQALSTAIHSLKNEKAKEIQKFLIIGQLLDQIAKHQVIYTVGHTAQGKEYL